MPTLAKNASPEEIRSFHRAIKSREIAMLGQVLGQAESNIKSNVVGMTAEMENTIEQAIENAIDSITKQIQNDYNFNTKNL